MDIISSLLRKKFIGREVKEMKKLIAIAMVVFFTFGTVMPASAFDVDVTRVLYAEYDYETGVAELKEMPLPSLRTVLNSTTGFSGPNTTM